jgi:hypothetical protein
MRAKAMLGSCLVGAACLAVAGCAEILGLEPPNGDSSSSASGGAGGTSAGGTSAGGTSSGGTSTGGTTSVGGAPPGGLLTFGGPVQDFAYSTVFSPAGVVVGGAFMADAMFGGMPLIAGDGDDAFYFEASPDLEVLTALGFGAEGQSMGTQVITAAAVSPTGEVALAGYFSGFLTIGNTTVDVGDKTDMLVIKLKAAGMVDWVRYFGGGADDGATGVGFLPNGDVVVAGNVQDTVIFDGFRLDGPGLLDGVVVKLTKDFGQVIDVVRIGGTDTDLVHSMAVAGDGSLTVVGSYQAAMDINPGGALPPVGGGKDAFVLHFDSAGTLAWALGLGDGEPQTALAVAVDPEGPPLLYVAGTFQSTIATLIEEGVKGTDDVFVLAIDPTSPPSVIWDTSFPDTGPCLPGELGLAVRKSNVIAVGAFSAPANFGGATVTPVGKDAFIVSLAGAAGPAWSRILGGDGDQIARAVTIPANGDIYVTGDFNGIMETDTGKYSTQGATDGFLLKITP